MRLVLTFLCLLTAGSAGIIVVCYRKDSDNKGHAIDLFFTDVGLVWWNPQRGEVPSPSAQELKTIYWPQ
jgi:hypothetical protein